MRRQVENKTVGVTLKSERPRPIKKSLHLLRPFPCLPVFFCEMQLEKVIIRILLFYLIKKKAKL
jgi:hypothetical protein